MLAETVLAGLLALSSLAARQVRPADDQPAAADPQTTVKLELRLGPGKTHHVTVSVGQTAKEVVQLCKPAKPFADDDPWVGYPAAAGGSYVLMFAAEGTPDQMKERLDPSRDKLYAVMHYPAESQEHGKFLLPQSLRDKSCGEIVTLKVLVAPDRARAVTVALGLNTDDVRQLLPGSSDNTQRDDVLLYNSIEDGDRYLLVFSPRDAAKARDPKTDKLSEVIYWQKAKSEAMYLFPRAKRSEAVPAEYRESLK
jgi:hypothetical protein